MTIVDVIVPVLGRPQNAQPLGESFAGCDHGVDGVVRLFFVASHDDQEELDTLRALPNDLYGIVVLSVPWPGGMRGDYARKINFGIWGGGCLDEPSRWILAGADDLIFHDGWAAEAIGAAEDVDACFVATNDLANPKVKAGDHATHPLVRRDYVLECGTIDCPGLLYHEGYFHQWVDAEASETAQARGCFVAAPASKVEHRHPIWATAPDDATYQHGNAHHSDDFALFRSRRKLWA